MPSTISGDLPEPTEHETIRRTVRKAGGAGQIEYVEVVQRFDGQNVVVEVVRPVIPSEQGRKYELSRVVENERGQHVYGVALVKDASRRKGHMPQLLLGDLTVHSIGAPIGAER